MTLTIRTATAADEPAWRGLWDQYLAFYNVTLTAEVTARTWARIIDPASTLGGAVRLCGWGHAGVCPAPAPPLNLGRGR